LLLLGSLQVSSVFMLIDLAKLNAEAGVPGVSPSPVLLGWALSVTVSSEEQRSRNAPWREAHLGEALYSQRVTADNVHC